MEVQLVCEHCGHRVPSVPSGEQNLEELTTRIAETERRAKQTKLSPCCNSPLILESGDRDRWLECGQCRATYPVSLSATTSDAGEQKSSREIENEIIDKAMAKIRHRDAGETPELLPCPCGAMTLTVMDRMAGCWIECECGWRGPMRSTKAEAVVAWTNIRAATASSRGGAQEQARRTVIKILAVLDTQFRGRIPWPFDSLVNIIEAEFQLFTASSRGGGERELYSRLVKMAASMLHGRDFLSQCIEDHPKQIPQRQLALQGEKQRERLRLWAIECREIADLLSRAAPSPPGTATEDAGQRSAQTELNDAVMYALKEGCFSPVPEPKAGASTQELIQWGAMRHLHDAIARFNKESAARSTATRAGEGEHE